MFEIIPILCGFAPMLALMALGIHVAVTLYAITTVAAIFYLGWPIALEVATQHWSATNNFVLVAIPLFILLGELLVRGGFTDRMYESLSHWLGRLPGGLLHTNLGASAMFAAVSGSSVATAATIGTVAIPALKGRGYNQPLVMGTIAAGATLGILIPPSVNLLIYGAMTGTSVGKLYLAGMVPGILLTLLFMLVVFCACLWRPAYAGKKEAPLPWKTKCLSLLHLLPPLFVFLMVMGSIYLGWATPTESAALGVTTAIGLCAAYGTLSIRMLHDSFVKTVSITAMIMLITSAAFFATFVLGIMGVPQTLAEFASNSGASQGMIFVGLTVFYLLLGCFLEAMAMMVGTIPIVFPIVIALGIDPVWFGIYLVIMAEIALITPPVGLNLYIVQGIRKEGSISTVILGVLPFLLAMTAFIFIIYFFPGLVLFLPELAM